MSITKRTFVLMCSIICAVLLAFNAATYLLFRYSITQQLLTSQEAVVEANLQLSNVFTQTVDKLVYQYTSDRQLGQALSAQVGRDALQDMNIRTVLNDRMAYQLNAEAILLNSEFRTELYLNPELEVSRLFSEENTIEGVSRVFNGSMVEQQPWYQIARSSRRGQYVFVSDDQTQLCFACKLQNSAYTGPHRKEGVGVLLGRLPMEQLPQLLALFPLTPNSGFLLLNEEGQQVFCSQNLRQLPTDGIAIPASTSTDLLIDGQRYICSTRRLEWNIQLVFLTPYGDILHTVWRMMSPYLLCSAVFLAVGVLLSLVLSRSISRPVVQFAHRLETIRDTRTVRWDDDAVAGPREIRQLSQSFGRMIRRVTALIQQVEQSEKQRRESELRALQAQINPHFVLNAMNAVNYMALEREQDDIAATVDSIASLMRYSITEPDRLVTMATELDNIREYIAVYVLRFRQDIQLQLLAGLDPAQVVIPKFTLQPLVENSIRHGITRRDAGITVCIRAYHQNGRLLVDVTDSGVGADAAKLNAYLQYQPVDLKVTHGFGIRNVNERIKLRFGPNSGLQYLNYDGTKLLARLCLPCADGPQ